MYMRKLGIIDARGAQYQTLERLHLIRCLSKWSANLYIFGQLTWGKSIRRLPKKEKEVFSQISNKCRDLGIELWAWMKPGDFRYVYHRSDRKQFIHNALEYMSLGADGFYLLMDDLHPRKTGSPNNHIRQKDAEYHAHLIHELSEALGNSFKAICGEHYHGAIPGAHSNYWDPILQVLPKDVLLTWTGPRIWNKALNTKDIPSTGWPLLLFDNYFASDTDDPKKSPIYPYDGRSPELIDHLEVAVINPNNYYPWQYCALQTAMSFWRAPYQYNAEASFKQAIRDMGDMYMEDYTRFVEQGASLDGRADETCDEETKDGRRAGDDTESALAILAVPRSTGSLGGTANTRRAEEHVEYRQGGARSAAEARGSGCPRTSRIHPTINRSRKSALSRRYDRAYSAARTGFTPDSLRT